MKPAEQWIKEDPMYAIFSELNYPVVINYIKAIQLDAWRKGMMDASTLVLDRKTFDTPIVTDDYKASRADAEWFIKKKANETTTLNNS